MRQFCGCRHGYCELVATTVSADGRSDRWTGNCDDESTISRRVSARTDPCGSVGHLTFENSWDPDESASAYPWYFSETGEGGAFKALTKYVGNPSEYHDWSFRARRSELPAAISHLC